MVNQTRHIDTDRYGQKEKMDLFTFTRFDEADIRRVTHIPPRLNCSSLISYKNHRIDRKNSRNALLLKQSHNENNAIQN